MCSCDGCMNALLSNKKVTEQFVSNYTTVGITKETVIVGLINFLFIAAIIVSKLHMAGVL